MSPSRTLAAAAVLLAGAFASRAAGQAADADLLKLRQEWQRAYQAKEWPRAIELSRKLIELQPKDGTFHYNLACCHAQSGDKPAAMAALREAADRGFSDADLVNYDLDLDPVRNEPGFEVIAARVQAAQRLVLDDFRIKAQSAVI